MDDSADAADEALRQAFSLRVERLRTARGLSRKQLARRVGSRTALGRWGKGRAWPRAKTLFRLSDVLGVTLDFLMLGRGPIHPSGDVDPSLLALKEAIEATPRELREAFARALLGSLSSSTGYPTIAAVEPDTLGQGRA